MSFMIFFLIRSAIRGQDLSIVSARAPRMCTNFKLPLRRFSGISFLAHDLNVLK